MFLDTEKQKLWKCHLLKSAEKKDSLKPYLRFPKLPF